MGIATDVSVELSPTGQPISRTATFTLTGTLTGTGSADIKAKIGALQLACAQPSPDLVLYLEDDATESATLLKSQGSLYGVVCTKAPSFPTTFGPENLTKRKWTAVFQAKYPWGVNPDGTGQPDDSLTTISFQESLQMSGGEPRYVFHEDINGAEPLLEITVPKTTYKAVQSGQASGYLGYPPLPPKMFGGEGIAVTEDVTFQGPPDGVKDWQARWTYTFESARPLVGLPHYWIPGGFRRGN